jgi:hypothetical protein
MACYRQILEGCRDMERARHGPCRHSEEPCSTETRSLVPPKQGTSDNVQNHGVPWTSGFWPVSKHPFAPGVFHRWANHLASSANHLVEPSIFTFSEDPVHHRTIAQRGRLGFGEQVLSSHGLSHFQVMWAFVALGPASHGT